MEKRFSLDIGKIVKRNCKTCRSDLPAQLATPPTLPGIE